MPPAKTPEGEQAWREVFQSSPASLAQFSDEEFRDYAKRSGLPEAYAEQLRAKPVSGTLRFRFVIFDLGTKLRLRVSNEVGTEPLVIAAASASLGGSPFQGPRGAIKRVTFGGEAGVTIPAGAPVVSDPIDLAPDSNVELVVSLCLPNAIFVGGFGKIPLEVAPGDQTMVEHLQDSRSLVVRPLVTGISMLTSLSHRVIGMLGDSLTDSNCSQGQSWPEHLHRRLAARTGGPSFSIANAGIGGNRLLAPGAEPEMGIAGLARLDRDILRVDGLSHLIVFEGTNDIGMSGETMYGDNPDISPEDVIASYRQIISRARPRDVKVAVATLPPFAGSVHDSPKKEATRQAVNKWIRTSGKPDAVIDFDAMLRDPANPLQLRSEYDMGDHLHLNAAGCEAMANGVDLTIFD